MASLGWFGKAVLSSLFLVPGFLAPMFFQKNFGIKPETTLFYFVIGMTIGLSLSLRHIGDFGLRSGVSVVVFFVIILLGFVFGTIANLLLFGATAIAPNPALPTSVAGLTNIFIYIAALALAAFLPKWFEAAKFDIVHLVAILGVIGCTALLAWKR